MRIQINLITLIVLTLCLFLSCKDQNQNATVVSGELKDLAGSKISLIGVNGTKETVLVTTTVDSLGYFSLNYPKNYKGIGNLQVFKKGEMMLLLNNKPINLEITDIKNLKTVVFKKDTENKLFKAYKNNTLLDKNIPKNSYLNYYIKTQKFIKAKVNNTSFKDYNVRFKQVSLQEKKLLNSGLWGNLIVAHFNKIEDSFTTTEVEKQYKIGIDYILSQIDTNEQLTEMVGELLINYFNKKSLIIAAEYLSLKLQNHKIENNTLKTKLRQHTDLGITKKAPNIVFAKPYKNSITKLSEIKSKKVVVFWASWCKHCTTELPKLKQLYPQLQEKGVEIVSVSLDTKQTPFLTKIEATGWVNYCDFKKWESPVAIDYSVFSTPTFYVLNSTNDIILKPKNVAQIQAYLQYLPSVKK